MLSQVSGPLSAVARFRQRWKRVLANRQNGAMGGGIIGSGGPGRFAPFYRVTANSESEVRERFRLTVQHWADIIDGETKEAAN
jgi:hypothetical protein